MARAIVRARGFTLVEVLVSLAVLTAVGIGVSSIVPVFFQSQGHLEAADVASEFSGSLERYLHSQEGCTTALVGQTLTGTATDLKVASYAGFGLGNEQSKENWGLAATNSSEIGKDSVVHPKVKVNALTFKDKPGFVVQQELGVGAAPPLFRHVVQVDLQMGVLNESADKNAPLDKRFLAVKPASLEIPVLTDSAGGGTITACRIIPTPEESCAAIGWKWDPAALKCSPDKTGTCTFRDTYIVRETQITYVLTSKTNFGAPGSFPPTLAVEKPNMYTGGISCPADANSQQSGRFIVSKRSYPGPKGKAIITETISRLFYVCVKCT